MPPPIAHPSSGSWSVRPRQQSVGVQLEGEAAAQLSQQAAAIEAMGVGSLVNSMWLNGARLPENSRLATHQAKMGYGVQIEMQKLQVSICYTHSKDLPFASERGEEQPSLEKFLWHAPCGLLICKWGEQLHISQAPFCTKILVMCMLHQRHQVPLVNCLGFCHSSQKLPVTEDNMTMQAWHL
jgi:hypothetical protein